jgi:competence protein ComEC
MPFSFLKLNRKLHLVLIVFLIGGVFLVWSQVGILLDGLWPKVVFLDVGQGDAVLIRAPGGSDILIDGGPNGARLLSELSLLRPLWDQTLEAVIITHPDSDHIRALLEVFNAFQVERVLITGVFHPTRTYQKLIKLLEAKDISALQAMPGEELLLDNKNFKLVVLSPQESLLAQKARKLNNISIVSRLSIGEIDFLLTADIEKEQELALAEDGLLKPAEVLKVAHHGSANSTDSRFLKVLNPALAVISVGQDNAYNHPAAEVLRRLQNIPVWRTDRQGTISFYTNGVKLWIKSSK